MGRFSTAATITSSGSKVIEVRNLSAYLCGMVRKETKAGARKGTSVEFNDCIHLCVGFQETDIPKKDGDGNLFSATWKTFDSFEDLMGWLEIAENNECLGISGPINQHLDDHFLDRSSINSPVEKA